MVGLARRGRGPRLVVAGDELCLDRQRARVAELRVRREEFRYSLHGRYVSGTYVAPMLEISFPDHTTLTVGNQGGARRFDGGPASPRPPRYFLASADFDALGRALRT